MPHEEEYTALAGWIGSLAKALDESGQALGPLLQRCDLPEEVCRNPDMRVPIAKLNRLLDLACEATGDPAFVLTLARYAHPSAFSILGYSMLASASLKEMLQRLVRFKRIVSNTCRLELVDTAQTGELRMHVARDRYGHDVLTPRSAQAFLVVVLRFMRELYREDLAPLQAGLPGPEPVYRDALRSELGGPVRFDAPYYYMVFSRTALETPLPTGNPLVTQLHERVLVQSMARLDRDDIVNAVRSAILDSLPMGPPTQAELADRLHISRRHLQRKLSHQGTSYKALLEETRRSLALQHLREGQLSLGEISYLLGFSSVNNFSRAFQRWVGEPPGQFRQRCGQKVA